MVQGHSQHSGGKFMPQKSSLLVPQAGVFGVDRDCIVAGLSFKSFLKFSVHFCVSPVVTLQCLGSSAPLQSCAKPALLP